MRSSKAGQSLWLLAGFMVMTVICLSRVDQIAGDGLIEAAKVTTGQFRPDVLHNCHRIYLYLLHGMFFLLGNKVAAGAILQSFLQMGTVFFFCFTVRRISGVPAAMAVLAVSCFSPYLFSQSAFLSPMWFFLFCYGGTMWLLTGVLGVQEQKKDLSLLVRSLAAGSLIGFCCYLDFSGITLVAFLIGVIWIPESGRDKVFIVLGCVLAALTAYFGLYAIRTSDSETLKDMLFSQWRLFAPGGFRFPSDAGVTWDFVLVIPVALAGLGRSLMRKRFKRQVVWLAAGIILLGMQFSGMVSAQPVNSFVLLYLFCVALAVCGLTEPDFLKECKMDNENKELKQESAEGENARPRYLENPLPLPKKHVKKVLDFDYDVPDDDDFDHP